MNILYEDTALVVLDKPAGLTSEEGVPAALRQRWGRPDAYVGVIHRLDTGVSGLMVYARTPGAAAALTKQVTESQQAYAILDGRAEAGPGAPAQPCFLKTYRAVIAGGPDEALPPEGILRDYLFKDSRKGRVFPVMYRVIRADRGTVTANTSTSLGEIATIIPKAPAMVITVVTI